MADSLVHHTLLTYSLTDPRCFSVMALAALWFKHRELGVHSDPCLELKDPSCVEENPTDKTLKRIDSDIMALTSFFRLFLKAFFNPAKLMARLQSTSRHTHKSEHLLRPLSVRIKCTTIFCRYHGLSDHIPGGSGWVDERRYPKLPNLSRYPIV